MKLKDYLEQINGKTDTELSSFLEELSYQDLYELWSDMTHQTIEVKDEDDDTTQQVEQGLKQLFEMAIYSETIKHCSMIVPLEEEETQK